MSDLPEDSPPARPVAPVPPVPVDAPIVDLSALAFVIGLLVLAVAMMLLVHH